MFRILIAFIVCLLCATVQASNFDNENKIYHLVSMPSTLSESTRMDCMKLSDQQPAGLYVKKGDVLQIDVSGLDADSQLAAHIGFRPMWNVALDQQEVALQSGKNRVVAIQSGPLFFRFNAEFSQRTDVEVKGGSPLPLFVNNEMSAADWRDELNRHRHAPFVQLLDDKAMITLPMKVYRNSPIIDPSASFVAIDEVIDLQNQLAGFDDSSEANRPSVLRQHYLVDFRVSKKDREDFYMYATDEFIGMLSDNSADLTDPLRLKSKWGIWHETGHVHQQRSWTWNAFTEVSVNLFSLYVQEKFGQQNRLLGSEDGGEGTFAQAREYLTKGAPDYLVDDPNYDKLFIKLVMLHQLRKAYGWESFIKLFQYYRLHPLPEDASDQDKADAFVVNFSGIVGEDLRPFLKKWGLRISKKADGILLLKSYPLPKADLASVFE